MAWGCSQELSADRGDVVVCLQLLSVRGERRRLEIFVPLRWDLESYSVLDLAMENSLCSLQIAPGSVLVSSLGKVMDLPLGTASDLRSE